MNLYNYGEELTAQIEAVQAMIDEGQDPNSEAVQAALRQMVEAESEWTAKAERVGLYIKQCEAEAVAIKTEADRLAKLAQSKTKRAEVLGELLKGQMMAFGLDKIEGSLCPIALRVNPWSVVVDNPETLPPQYQRAKIEADKKALLKDREQLQAVGGVVFERKTSIRIGA